MKEEWQTTAIVPSHKGKRGEGRRVCKGYRGISLLSVAGKLYAEAPEGRVLRD